MKVRFKKLYDGAVMPSKAHDTDAGFDLTAAAVAKDKNGRLVAYTGIAVEIPKGFVGLLFPRSSIAKHHLSLTNSVGVIDSGYRGEIMLKFREHSAYGSDEYLAKEKYIEGDKVGQLIIMPYPEIEFEEVEELSDSDRGEGGYGSSGR